MDLNEFPSTFQKVQYSQSRHQKTTSHLLRINLKSVLKLNGIWPLEGAMYIGHSSMEEFSGASQKLVVYSFLRKFKWFQTNRFTGLLELIQLYKQDQLEKYFIFTIYHNYTLALRLGSLGPALYRIGVQCWITSFHAADSSGTFHFNILLSWESKVNYRLKWNVSMWF